LREDSVYEQIFGTTPNVYRVWRSVELLRAVRAELQARWCNSSAVAVAQGASRIVKGGCLITVDDSGYCLKAPSR
jgi:hypothetical protein